jgi:hypothetical protein
MSKAEKLFDKVMAGQSDANFLFDDLCTLLTKLGYMRAPQKAATLSFGEDQASLICSPREAEKQSLIRCAKSGKSCKN